MTSSFAHDLLVNGLASAKAKEYSEARRLLERALSLDLDNQEKIEALYWLSEVTNDPVEQRNFLETILAMDMSNGRARRKLAILNGQIKLDEIIDPNNPQPTNETDPQSIHVRRFVCPQCGGRMVFRPDGQALICEYCESKAASTKFESPIPAEEQDFFVAMATRKGHYKLMATRNYACEGCGANFQFHPNQLTLNCPHCDSALIVQDQESREIVLPTGVIPFNINEIQAKQALRSWLREKLADEPARVTRGSGIYLPVWTFDLSGAITYRYKIFRDKKWVELNGEDHILNNDIIIPATKNIHPLLQQQFAYFDLLKAVGFKEEFLSNWPAETYQITVSDASLKARELVFQAERKQITDNTSGQIEDLFVSSSRMSVVSFKLILLPMWIISYWHKEQRYTVTINGQDGYIIGETPAKGIRKWVEQILGEN
jgi:predicted RNA-binding Zn-ribbon protein involved in translation (DUF1610 family)